MMVVARPRENVWRAQDQNQTEKRPWLFVPVGVAMMAPLRNEHVVAMMAYHIIRMTAAVATGL